MPEPRIGEFSQAALAAHRGPDDPPLPDLRERARAALADGPLQEAMSSTARIFRAGQQIASADPELPELRRRGERIRTEGVQSLGENLRRLEANLRALGVHVHHASDGADARRIVVEIAERAGVGLAVKSKSMATEEVFLNDALEAAGVEVVETDLGEYIVQLAHERPAHIIAPAVHKSRSEVARLFEEVAGGGVGDDRRQLTAFARDVLRDKFLRADMGITGVNFACADTGTLAMVSNEGNLRLSTTLPRVHVALMPIEKVLPRLSDLATMLPLLVRSATGQRLTSYVSLVTGPRRPGDPDGPTESHLVVLDNGRSRLRGGPYEEMLRCIRCAACLNVCPVYRKIGGHAYGGAYSGPMGAVLGTLLEETSGSELPYASTLCGACADACPVGIPLDELLYKLRADPSVVRPSPLRGAAFTAWSLAWSWGPGYRASSALASLAARMARAAGRGIGPLEGTVSDDGRWLLRTTVGAADETIERALPLPAPRDFRQWWSEHSPRAQATALGGSDAGESVPGHDAPNSAPESAGAAQPRDRDPVEALTANLSANGFEVRDARQQDPVEVVAEIASREGGVVVVDPGGELEGISDGLRVAGIDVRDAARENARLASVGVSRVAGAIAETGSLLAVLSPTSPRTTSLLPETHVALVPAGTVHGTLGEALAALRAEGLPSGAVIISGPSKTADIELTLTTGVHGPGRVVAVITD